MTARRTLVKVLVSCLLLRYLLLHLIRLADDNLFLLSSNWILLKLLVRCRLNDRLLNHVSIDNRLKVKGALAANVTLSISELTTRVEYVALLLFFVFDIVNFLARRHRPTAVTLLLHLERLVRSEQDHVILQHAATLSRQNRNLLARLLLDHIVLEHVLRVL